MSEATQRHPTWALALGLTLLVGIFPQFAIGALGPQLQADLQLGPSDLGLVFAGLYAIGVFGSPLAGPLVDRIGGRHSCLGLLVVAGGALLLASFAGSGVGLSLAMLPAGAAMAFANPGTTRWASTAATARAQARLVGIGQAGVQAGALAAGALAAASAVGLDWRATLRIGALVAAVGAVLAWASPSDHARTGSTSARAGDTKVGHVRGGHARGGHARDGGATAGQPGAGRGPSPAGRRVRVATDPGVRTRRSLAAYALLMGGGSAVVFAYLPTFASDVGGLSVSTAGATVMVYGGTALVCRLLLGFAVRRPDRLAVPLMVAMAVGSATAIVLMAASGAVPALLWVGAVLFGATGTTWPAVAFLALVRASPPGTAGRTTGWVTAAFYLALWVTPPVSGALIPRLGYWPVWAGAATIALSAALPAARARPGRHAAETGQTAVGRPVADEARDGA
ncbi:MFS transporter [Egicoccus sp. AB-alg2]|uniref:MFS transporter n=1 Tax=Egicoccus sp. AB-alg2 TaxID=3242693 RepID=UPI00359E3AC8